MANLVAGANQTATVPITVRPSGLSCGVQVFLTSDAAGTIIKAQSTIKPFSSMSSLQSVAATLTAPVAGTYYVFVAVYIAGVLIGVWINGTVMVSAPTPLWTYSSPAIDANWQVGVSYFNWIRYRCQITNPSSQAVAKAISLMYKLKIPPSATFQGVTIFKTYNPPIPLGPFYGSTNIPQADLAAVIAWYIAGGFENLYGNFYNQSVASQNAAWQAWISATGKVYPSGILIPVGGSYQFDSCGIEGITGPGYSATGGETIDGYRGGGWIYEVWLRDADGTESTHLQVST
jgi:hypothetical protein